MQMVQKQKNTTIFIMLIFLSVLLFPTLFVVAQETAAVPVEYSPISPIVQGGVDTTDPGSYLNTMFGILVGVAGMLAVIMLVVCGVQYMMSDAIGGKEAAKKRCTAAILGLFVILISWIGLNTISPDLVAFTFKQLRSSIQEGVGVEGEPTPNPNPSTYCYVDNSGNSTSYTNAQECDSARNAALESSLSNNSEYISAGRQIEETCRRIPQDISLPPTDYCYTSHTSSGSTQQVCRFASLNICDINLNSVIETASQRAFEIYEETDNSISSCFSSSTCASASSY